MNRLGFRHHVVQVILSNEPQDSFIHAPGKACHANAKSRELLILARNIRGQESSLGSDISLKCWLFVLDRLQAVEESASISSRAPLIKP